MKLKSVAVLAVCGAFVASIAATVDQIKYTSFTAVGGANPDVDGVGKMKLDSNNRVKVQFTISGLAPNTAYRVTLSGGELEADYGDNPLVTNANGNAHWDDESSATILTGDETINIWLDSNGDNVLEATEKVAVSAR